MARVSYTRAMFKRQPTAAEITKQALSRRDFRTAALFTLCGALEVIDTDPTTRGERDPIRAKQQHLAHALAKVKN